MNRFVIAPDFLESIDEENNIDLFLNVLVVFAQDNPYKLCVDSFGLADSIYTSVCEPSELLRRWISYLNSKSRNKEIVRLPDEDNYDSKQSLFLAISDAIPPGKRLVTSNKPSYNRWQGFITEHGISLIDGDEAKDQIQRTTVINQTSIGNNSPNIIGNLNSV